MGLFIKKNFHALTHYQSSGSAPMLQTEVCVNNKIDDRIEIISGKPLNVMHENAFD